MNNQATTPPQDQDEAQGALAALRRAGLRAAEEALRTNTYMVVAEDGKVEHLTPLDYLRQRGQLKPASN
jgi:hypothetical protein